MSTSDPEETPRRRRRSRKKASEDAPASDSPRPEPEAGSESEPTRGDADADASPTASVEGGEAAEVEPSAEDVAAVEAAADVVLEADDEAEGESELVSDDDSDAEDVEAEAEEAEAPAASRRRRRRGAAEPAEEEAAAPAPAPQRRRRGARGERRDVVVRAQAKYVRSSARKARLVCDHIRGKSVEEARAILAHTSRAVARDWSKLLESAVANAENNHELVGEDLYVKDVHADEGPTIRRFRPRAMGRATRIRKRTSHLTILLTPKD
ncbi:MAG: 50S ribosomal protein L22 [Solirubrobacterales bacterium]|nr:50S ribosomal protein L22 [Solirubrobacterales bacterium]